MQFIQDINMFCIVAIVVLVSSTHGVPVTTDGDGAESDELNGEKLVEFGKKLKKPMLQLIGETIETIEDQICGFHSCLTWTEWSECSIQHGQFGSRLRTRQCGLNSTSCENEVKSRMETEFDVCVKNCPHHYNVTKHGFCMKLYADKRRTQDEAEKQCQNDGGHLINIESQEKYEDVKMLVKGTGSNTYEWIDGRRKGVTSPWMYKYGSQKGFFKWYSGRPGNNLCLKVYLRYNGLFWYDNSCSSSYNAICEIYMKN